MPKDTEQLLQAEQLPLENVNDNEESEEKKDEKKKSHFYRDGNCWYWDMGGDKHKTDILTNFHLQLIRIVQKFNYQDRRWERWFDLEIYYTHKGREIVSPIMTLEPRQTGIPTEFSNAIWDVDFRTSYIKDPITLKSFIAHLYREQKPKEVRIIDHFGFVTINRKRYYITKNTLIQLPENEYGQLLFIAADQDGAFQVDPHLHVALDPDLDGSPWIENVGIQEDGLYKMPAANLPAGSGEFLWQLEEIEEHLCQMISGQQKSTLAEGSLLLGYVFSQIIFDDIFKAFNHVIYLYIYGPGNSGKGSVCEVILSFFGLPFYPSPNPTLSALETLLGTHSKIPLWVDEFVPEHTPGKKNNLPDQYWNSYFQLTHRPVSSHNRYKTATPKPVRASVLFCSNYLPKTDHFNSRLLKLEYKIEKRGKELHYRALQNKKTEMQQLFLSALQRSRSMRSAWIQRELYYIKTRFHEVAKHRLEQKETREGSPFTLHDRQTEQFAALYLSYQLFKDHAYYNNLELYMNALESENEDRAYIKGIRGLLDDSEDGHLFQYCVDAIITHSLQEAERDTFSDFMDVVGDLVNSPENTNYIQAEKHFHWAEDDLLLYWSAIWNRYSKQIGRSDALQHKAYIQKCLDALDEKGCRHNVNWTAPDMMGSVRQKGYRIKNAAQDQRFTQAFKHQ